MQGGAGSRARADYGSSAAVEKTGLSMYAESPEEEVTLEDFEIWSFQRLKSAWPHASTLALRPPLKRLSLTAPTALPLPPSL